MRRISPARISTFEILKKIEQERAFSSVLLPHYEEDLEPKDRGLCHQLTLGVLRKQIYLDRIIEKLTNKSISKLDVEVILALRIGLYQILFLDKIPAYSAINESVNLVHRAKKRSAGGFVNAVLRRGARDRDISLDHTDEIERISAETSHPRWLIENWIGQFGIEEAKQIAAANNEIPKSAFRMTAKFYARNTEQQKKIRDQLELFDLARSSLLEDCFIINKANSRIRELAAAGDIYFQEEGSQLIGSVINLQGQESFLDICAAPGSKVTFVVKQLADEKHRETWATSQNHATREQSANRQNLIVAGDFYPHRLRVLLENCQKQRAGYVNILRYDALENLPFADQTFEAVLLDAPCTGTGTIRNNPEIRNYLAPQDFKELSGKQLKILRNASKVVKRGGRIIYSTCSLEKAENEAVIEEFLTGKAEFEIVPPNLPQRMLTPDGFGRTFPNRDQIDGFFIAVLKRK